jgi:predicted metalloprotease
MGQLARWSSIGRASREFVLIVVGVLVALSADQWREEQNRRKVERAHLSAIRADAEAAITIVEGLRSIEQRRLEANEILLADVPPAGVPSDSLSLVLF